MELTRDRISDFGSSWHYENQNWKITTIYSTESFSGRIPFTMVELTCSGTFGAVHKARKVNTNRIVAVKIIRSLHGSSVSQDLEREIRIMKKLDHVLPHL